MFSTPAAGCGGLIRFFAAAVATGARAGPGAGDGAKGERSRSSGDVSVAVARAVVGGGSRDGRRRVVASSGVSCVASTKPAVLARALTRARARSACSMRLRYLTLLSRHTSSSARILSRRASTSSLASSSSARVLRDSAAAIAPAASDARSCCARVALRASSSSARSASDAQRASRSRRSDAHASETRSSSRRHASLVDATASSSERCKPARAVERAASSIASRMGDVSSRMSTAGGARAPRCGRRHSRHPSSVFLFERVPS